MTPRRVRMRAAAASASAMPESIKQGWLWKEGKVNTSMRRRAS